MFWMQYLSECGHSKRSGNPCSTDKEYEVKQEGKRETKMPHKETSMIEQKNKDLAIAEVKEWKSSRKGAHVC